MPKYLDRATRQLVTQYGSETSTPPALDDPTRQGAAPKTFTALEKLLDACVEAEANSPRGRIPMVTTHWIRKQITEALEADG